MGPMCSPLRVSLGVLGGQGPSPETRWEWGCDNSSEKPGSDEDLSKIRGDFTHVEIWGGL